MICSINKAQTDTATDTPPTPQEERAADLCVLSELVEIQMSIARATQQEALQAPQPGVDYGQRIATIARSVRLTLLLKRKLADERAERRKAAAKREAAQEDWHALRVKLAVLAASYESSKDAEEVDRRSTEVCERVERPEVAELIEASRAEVAVAALGLSGAGGALARDGRRGPGGSRLPAVRGRRGRRGSAQARPGRCRPPQAQGPGHGVSVRVVARGVLDLEKPSVLPLPLAGEVGGACASG
ncbi:MAG TPA: hypothetical protein VIQ53_04315 [Inquilinus sp.]